MKTGNFSEKLNNIPFGLLIGIVVAVIASFVIMSMKNTAYFGMFENKQRLTFYIPYLKLGAFVNLAPFFIFNHYRMLEAQKGVIFSMILLFIFAVGVNYLL